MAVQSSDLDCHKCGDLEKQIRGCEKEVRAYRFGDIEVTRCPLKLVTQATKSYISAYNGIKNLNALMCEGGIFNQPAKLMDVMSILDRETLKRMRQK